MKILYGVQGTGNGHISRTRMMARHLNARPDVQVTYLFSGRPREQYFDMEVFGDFLCRRGLTFQVRNGRISTLQTALRNNLLTLAGEIRALDLAPYDLIITDFEPVTAWAGRLKGRKVLGLGHQYAFRHDVPREGETPLSRFLMRQFAPADDAFGLHWHSFGGVILPPIVDPRLNGMAAQTGTEPRKVIVYLPFENQHEVTTLLRQLPDYRFYQYSGELTDGEIDNVRLRKANHSGFLRDLCSASAVICNAGFELVSESLQLGLQVLVKPLHGQPEQLSNAAALTALGLGERTDAITLESISTWLTERPTISTRASIGYPDVAAALVNWILDDRPGDPRELVDSLWAQCGFREPPAIPRSVAG